VTICAWTTPGPPDRVRVRALQHVAENELAEALQKVSNYVRQLPSGTAERPDVESDALRTVH